MEDMLKLYSNSKFKLYQIAYVDIDGLSREEILCISGLAVNIRIVEIPCKIAFHSLMLIIPLFYGLWMYLLQLLFFSPYIIYKSIKGYWIYPPDTGAVYRSWLDFIFEIIVPVYRHDTILRNGGYQEWYK